MQPILVFATTVVLTVVADLAANLTEFPVPSLSFYEVKSNRDLPMNKYRDRFDLDRKVFVRGGEPMTFNVLVNASGILEFAMVSRQPGCKFTISLNPQQNAQITIHPVYRFPMGMMQLVEGKDPEDFMRFKHVVRDSGSRFDFVVDGQSVGITFNEVSGNGEPGTWPWPYSEKILEISRWMMWDYGDGTQKRVNVNVSSTQPACRATLIFPSSTAFVFEDKEEDKPRRLLSTDIV